MSGITQREALPADIATGQSPFSRTLGPNGDERENGDGTKSTVDELGPGQPEGNGQRDATRVIHAGHGPDPLYGSVSMPIYQSSTFAFETAEIGALRYCGEEPGFAYTRLGNPTTQALETCVAELEHGCGGLATATGMAAISTVYTALLDKDAHVVATDAIYGPSRTLLEREFSRFGVRSDFVDTSRIELVERALRSETRMLFIETPANPTMAITDIEACAELAGARDILLVVDNSFCSPLLQNPLDFGANVVIHSLTKSLNGHSDVMGGMIITRSKSLLKRIRDSLRRLGGTIDPHQSWLVLRGIRTLSLRLACSQANAGRLARYLENHPKVAWVRYPGLRSHAQHALASRQMKGYGSMLCFGLKGGLSAGRRAIDAVRLCTRAVSLGGVESLIQHPASMTHAGVPAGDRIRAGITDDLIRLSVGCEAAEDLIGDLEQALLRA
jgi:methionine-gamma-lyase